MRGVYAVRVEGLEETAIPGVANIGIRPTVEDDQRYLLEVHLFGFDRSVYGEHIAVEFVRKLRDEKRFENFEALRQQILLDADEARAILGVAR